MEQLVPPEILDDRLQTFSIHQNFVTSHKYLPFLLLRI
jgi:hypothetical protein